MNDYFLKAGDRPSLIAALEAAGILDGEGMVCDGFALDVIGTITRPSGEIARDERGMPVPVLEALPGFHANLRGVLTSEQSALLPLIPAPSNPFRVWA